MAAHPISDQYMQNRLNAGWYLFAFVVFLSFWVAENTARSLQSRLVSRLRAGVFFGFATFQIRSCHRRGIGWSGF